MKAIRNSDGLYIFPLVVHSQTVSKKLNGLIDTGSNTCACSHRIPVTLRARNTSFKLIATPASEKPIPAPGLRGAIASAEDLNRNVGCYEAGDVACKFFSFFAKPIKAKEDFSHAHTTVGLLMKCAKDVRQKTIKAVVLLSSQKP